MIEDFQRLALVSTQYYTQLASSEIEPALKNCPPFKHIDSMTITNFKSFKGKVYVGPFLDNTCIIGPNGSGKSNALEALLFCFGNQSAAKYFDIRDLMFRENRESFRELADQGYRTEVEVVMVAQNGRKVALKRRLSATGEQTYFIDGEEYEEKFYLNFLMRHHINHICSNFAIWQGEIDKFLLKDPEEMQEHLEVISGSNFFKRDQKNWEQDLEVIRGEMAKAAEDMARFKNDRKRIKVFNQAKEEREKALDHYQELANGIMIAKTHLNRKQEREEENEYAKVEKEEREKIKEINEAKARMMKQRGLREELMVKLRNETEAAAQTRQQMKMLSQASNFIDHQDMEDLQKQLEEAHRYMENLERKQKQLSEEMSEVQSTSINKEYLQLYQRWQRENKAIDMELSKKKREFAFLEGIIQTKKAVIEDFDERQAKLEQQKKQEGENQLNMQRHIKEVEHQIADLKKQSAQHQQTMHRREQKIQKLTGEIGEVNEHIIQLQGYISESIENEKDRELVRQLNQVDGFEGVLGQWVKAASKRYEVVFHVMMEGVSDWLLCRDEFSVKRLSIILKELEVMKSCVILNNIPDRRSTLTRADLNRDAEFAIDALQYENKVSKLDLYLKEYLRGKIICKDMDKAWQLYERNIKGVRQIYTLDGDMLTSQGLMVTHGRADHVKNRFKYISSNRGKNTALKEVKEYEAKKKKLESELEAEATALRAEKILRKQEEVNKLQLKKEELIQKMEASKQLLDNRKKIKPPQGLAKELKELEFRQQIIEESIKNIEKDMMSSKIFSEFLKSHKIEGLDSFRSVQDFQSLEKQIHSRSKTATQLQQVKDEINHTREKAEKKREKLKMLQEKVEKISKIPSFKVLESKLIETENTIKKTRLEIEKLQQTDSQLRFRSKLPQLAAKMTLNKEKNQDQLRQEAHKLGLVELPGREEQEKFERKTGLNLDRVSLKKLEDFIEQAEEDKEKLEKEIQEQTGALATTRMSEEEDRRLMQEIDRLAELIKSKQEQKGEVEEKLEEVKSHRQRIFVEFFQRLRPILKSTYHILTETREGLHGNADIYMEDPNNPLAEGLYFSPTPPEKRFTYDLGQLSGGEKSIASLALLHAIAVASRAPFLILDEPDCFLDAENVRRFVRLISASTQDQKMQFVIITHKRDLFLTSDSLVGAVMPKDMPNTHIYSLLLNEESDYRGNRVRST